MSELISKVSQQNLPQHVAIIMDGNGRWAKQKGQPRVFGHKNALTSVRESVEIAAELGVKYLTLYAFSTENWNRPTLEVQALMTLLVSALTNEVKKLNKNNIKLTSIGDLEKLPKLCLKELKEAEKLTQNNTHMQLILALSYSGRWEITEAIKKITSDVVNNKLSQADITEQTIANYLETKNIPDPELLIRTSGETRISNFLLWQLAYAEMYFTTKLWPDFRKADFVDAIVDYQSRERRFGKTSEQIKPNS